MISMRFGGRPRPRLTPGGSTGSGIPAAIMAAFFAAATPGFGPGLPLRVPRSRGACGCRRVGAACPLMLFSARAAFAGARPPRACASLSSLQPRSPSSAPPKSSYSSSDDGGEYRFAFFGGLPRPRFGGDAGCRQERSSLETPAPVQNAPGARNARPDRDADPGAPESLPGLTGIRRAAAASASASFIAARRARFRLCSYSYAPSGSALRFVVPRFRECFPRGVGDASSDINRCANPRTGDGGPSRSAFTSSGDKYPAL